MARLTRTTQGFRGCVPVQRALAVVVNRPHGTSRAAPRAEPRCFRQFGCLRLRITHDLEDRLTAALAAETAAITDAAAGRSTPGQAARLIADGMHGLG
jgi:hypothetical protein